MILAPRIGRGTGRRALLSLVLPPCLLACTPASTGDPQSSAPRARPTAAAQVPQAAAAPVPPTPQVPTALAGYQRAVAEKIERASSMDARRVAATPQVTALTVLGIKVDRKGAPVEVWVVRSSRQTALDQRALRSVHAAAPLPAPPASVLAGGDRVAFSETWMFLADGRFQLLGTGAGR